jgi:hypothetical protein
MALMLTLLVDPTAIEPSEESIETAERVYGLEKVRYFCDGGSCKPFVFG